MMQVNLNNEIVKRKYFRWLKEAEGKDKSTIDKIEISIQAYESFTNHSDFRTYNLDQAVNFKNQLKTREYRNKTISLSTYNTYVRYLKKFFTWLCGQPGYKSKIKSDEVKYLNILDKEERIATQSSPRKFPSLEQVIQVVNCIEINSEIDKRDRALISFTALTGMRDKAIITLPIGCFDPKNYLISQDPKQGVQTKYAKFIPSVLFKFDKNLVEYVLDWYNYLKTNNFYSTDPLFPRNKVSKGVNNMSFEVSSSIEPFYWKDTSRIREIFKKRFQQANISYYPPHSFRHLAFQLALKSCKNGEQFKAVSQNFGHENLATTFGSYANNPPYKLSEILAGIDFSGKPINNDREILEKIFNLIQSKS